ncbi:acyl-CoA dehydrogenase family protein [uncultured Mycolicibacterium sp.]|uniref:acyl-CoA dehydrogenase family protein n=1 Tax=uncultured Mycolicibacterium sp. TaxID=2320817 RepID=UPI002627CF3C|nr:acyl-CoA dehydrogenase family protein [uncultured Mycolicibacterium sp.]
MPVTPEFVQRLADRAAEAEQLRRLPDATVADLIASGLTELLVPARFGGRQADFPAILDPVRRLAHGCTSSAWTIGFFVLHNWMLALFPEQAQREVFADRPVLAPAPLAPNGRGLPADGGVRISGRWSWATGIMHANWVLVGALCGPDDGIFPALALLPADQVRVEDTWHTAGMRATGSADVVVEDVFVPEHRLLHITDINAGTAPGAALHDAPTYRWPMVPALALLAAMPALGSAERVTDLFAERLGGRVLAYEGTAQKDKPIAQAHLARARVRIRALHGLLDDTVGRIEALVAAGTEVPRQVRADTRLAAAHIVHESRSVIADLVAASGASAQFLSHPMQRYKRDVDVLAGHVAFDYDTARELAGALELGLPVSPFALI